MPTPTPRTQSLTPTPKPRTLIPQTETNRDAKAVKQSGTPEISGADNYQSIPDVVFMTQKISPYPELTGKNGTKSTFRINPISSTEAHLAKNTECKDHGEEFVQKLSSHSQSIVQSQKNKINKDIQNTPKKVSNFDNSSGSSRNPLHLELVSKFTTSSSLDGKITCLQKVKTKEPKSVKELFSDYSFEKQQSRTHDELQYNIQSDKTVSCAENINVSRKLLQSPSGLEEKTVQTASNSKIYDFTVNKTPATPVVSNYRDVSNKTSSGLPKAHHQSLRVMKSGAGTEDSDKNSLTRGIAARKSLGKVECVVQL